MIATGFTALDIEHCILNETRIDLWQFSLESEVPNAKNILNAEEIARAQRFYFSPHQRRFSTARATLRIILGRYLNINPAYLEFTYNPQGKPKVINSAKLQFNLSHSADLALLAVGKGFPMGIDIERYSARPYQGIAKNSFSNQEVEEFMKAPSALKPALFFHIWSQKEAFIKACGLGLSYPTKEFNVPTTIPTKQLVDDPLNNITWHLRSFMPQIAYSGALCCHPAIREIRYGTIQLQTRSAQALRF
jgi:4'-phosphopantetheinyl transferase